jgi:hypothetical protein
MTEKMYQTWKDIVDMRKTQGYSASNVMFIVYENYLEDDKKEYKFDLTNE